MKMNCAGVRDLLPEYAVGALAAPVVRQLEAHIPACEECAGELALVRMLRDQTIQAPAWLDGRIQAAVAEEWAERPSRSTSFGMPAAWRRFATPRRGWALATAATAILALGTSLMLSRDSGAPSDEEVWLAFFDGVRSVWVAGDGVVAGAPLLDELSDLSDAQLALLLEEIGR